MTLKKIEIDLERVEELASLGLSRQQISDALGISARTLYNRQNDDAEFAEAIKRGKAKGVGVAASKLMELVGEGNLGAICFFLKTQGGFVESQRQIIETGENEEKSEGLRSIYDRIGKANKKPT